MEIFVTFEALAKYTTTITILSAIAGMFIGAILYATIIKR